MTPSQQQHTVVAPFEYTDPDCPQRARYPITAQHTVTASDRAVTRPVIAEALTLHALLQKTGPLTVAALTERAAPGLLAEEIRAAHARGDDFDPLDIIIPLVGDLEYAGLVTAALPDHRGGE